MGIVFFTKVCMIQMDHPRGLGVKTGPQQIAELFDFRLLGEVLYDKWGTLGTIRRIFCGDSVLLQLDRKDMHVSIKGYADEQNMVW